MGGAITTHVLDIASGRPAAAVPVALERETGLDEWHVIGRGETDADGRLATLMNDNALLVPGSYRLVFDTRRYFDAQGRRGFHPRVIVVFEVARGEEHYHVPLLLAPFGYTTYRGS
ncbi:MAG TPA: hydroxyisourate hydrolase [Vicinamibacterales bacterium]|nr:hydroxyisourate hydrolase [Vicinamibacterales bacterium]